MLQLLGERYKKYIALLLANVFYVGFLGQLHAAVICIPANVTSSGKYLSSQYFRDTYKPLFKEKGIVLRDFSEMPILGAVATKKNPATAKTQNDKLLNISLSKPEVVMSSRREAQKLSPKIGPTQPESSSFQSAGTDNMVDLFTGNFSYNIPLLDVGGYPVSIHYSSGITMDQEASWTGLGWNINPGSVNRTMRGLPDDFNGQDSIKKTESVKDNKTVSVNGAVSGETIGLPVTAGMEMSVGVLFNNYMGWGIETGISPSISCNLAGGKNVSGTLSGSLSVTNNTMSGASISPSLSFSIGTENRKQSLGVGVGTSYNNRTGISSLQLHGEIKQSVKSYEKTTRTTDQRSIMDTRSIYAGLPVSSYISFATPSYSPTITMPFKNTAYSFSGRMTGEVWGLSLGLGITGSVQKQTLAYKTKSVPAYGYLHFTKAMDDPEGLMDFNREKELAFNSESTPHIAVPVYTPDLFSISGEGTGGMFRAYRGDLGYIRDHKMQTTSGSDKLSVDLGFGGYVHVGTDLMLVDASTTNEAWKEENNLISNLKYTNNDTTYESVYFKNPGEQTVVDKNFYAALGNDDLLRTNLSGSGENVKLSSQFDKIRGGGYVNGSINVTAPITRKERDKRTQLITYYTAEQADRYGTNRKIFSYPENELGKAAQVNVGGDTSCLANVKKIDRVGGIRKANHISEIDVLGNDGKKYVYGIPVYNTLQQDVTFSVAASQANMDKGLIQYEAKDTTVNNDKGKEGYYSKTETPAYAHSFLLTEILSPDYVDIRGDGVTDDDLGDAIRFNYTQICNDNNAFQWRIPYTNTTMMANYNEGFKSYSRDDKGTYVFGKKELWYLNTIESKNFVAVFTTSKSREDVLNTNSAAGGLTNDADRAPRRLERIDLYSKADWVKNKANAKPVKSVYFEYDYSLCKGVALDANKGKLTLKAIWFSYNNGKKKNPYRFNYNGANPSYNPARYDRWGNYKDIANNPDGMNNYDYPYVLQDSVLSANSAAAWSLTDIQLPAGGKLKITYESDDYGYVQNKRASRLFKIDGFGVNETDTPTKNIYDGTNEKLYVFATLPVATDNLQELKERYLKGIKQLHFKLNVPMPNTDKWGTGGTKNSNEWIPLYADIDNFGFVGTSKNKIWIKVKDIKGTSPFKKVVLQFLRLNLPSKAYPNSETGSDVNFNDMVKVIFSSMDGYRTLLTSFEAEAVKNKWCREVELNRSFVRLNEPSLKRYGGGLRVKRIELFDSWNSMTGGKQLEASYGKEYDYTTTENLNGTTVTISSGVASYEPQIGGDENPFRIAKELQEKTNLLAPVNLMYSEEPLGESFFPGAMVGYSKVRIRTIHDKYKSADGWSETEFYTTKDFPTLTEMTPLDGDSKKSFRSKLGEFLKIDSRQYMNVSQGFKIELNDMNGKTKAQASYGETDQVNPIAYTRYYYKVDDERADHKHLNNDVSVVSGAKGEVTTGLVGKDIEVMVDLRQQLSKTTSTNLGINVDIIPGGVWPIPLPSAIPFPQKEIMRFRSAAVVKIINRYGLLDSVVQIDKGSVVSTKNLVWDGESGQVVVSRTNNEFNDPVYNLSYPAYWAYDGMAPAYKNIGINLGNTVTNKQLKIIKGKLFDYDNNTVDNWEKFFSSGDEIIVQRDQEEDVKDITPLLRQGLLKAPIMFDPGLCGDPTWRDVPVSRRFIKIWAIDAGLGKEKSQGIYFIDQDGRPYSCKGISEMRIIRSGRRNIMSANAGSLVSLATPIRVVNGVNKIEIDAQTKILQASAATYKNLWKVVNHWYVKDTIVEVRRQQPTLVMEPDNVSVSILDIRDGGLDLVKSEVKSPSNYIVSSFNYTEPKRFPCGRHSRQMTSGSNMFYDFNKLGKSPIINSARLSLFPYAPTDVFSYVGIEGKSGWPCNNSRSTYNWYWNTNYYSKVDNIASVYNDVLLYRKVKRNGFITRTDGTPITITQTNYSNLDFTLFVQNSIDNRSFVNGFSYNLKYSSSLDDGKSQMRFLSFGARNVNGAKAPQLTLPYSHLEDSSYQICKQYISDTVVNPYRFGILGNWHVDRSYVYYSDRDARREADLSAAIPSMNVRTDGTLTTFKSFWTFSSSGLTATTDTTQWTWNSAENFFNRKGYEMENYDALYRYNSGQYGYNQQLAIAATQNAKNRETFFDGFEDYDYKTNNCNYLCKDTRIFDGFTITKDDSHTGFYSLSLPANQSKTITLPLTYNADTTAALSIKVDSSLKTKETASPKGSGLPGSFTACGTTVTRTDPTINFSWAEKVPVDYRLCATGVSRMVWRGKLQAPESDTYTFYLDFAGGRTTSCNITINGFPVVAKNDKGAITANAPQFLQVGRLYDIVISASTERSHDFVDKLGNFFSGVFNKTKTDNYKFDFSASWSRSNSGGKEIIPQKVLYPIGADTSGSFKSTPFYCIKLNRIKPENILLPKVAPVKGKDVVVTAWVKIKDDNTNTASTDGLIPIRIQYAGASRLDTLKATGVRIEGWQRYEVVTPVPASATNMQLVFNPGTKNILVDDIRIHPFNSNMKSFVYDPISLKLMAELDENNYATYYEYDDEGNLMRLKKETERGIMTIKETRSNTQTILQ